MTKEEMNDTIFRVLADHIRTLCFSIADGILPGNEGRNYVLRRILRRAVLFGKRLDLEPGFFVKLVDPLVNKMRDAFPELDRRREMVRRVIESEERAFERTLERGLLLLEDYFANKDCGGVLSGEAAFVLYDTYGFPIDLTQIIAEERGFTVDIVGFEAEMQRQRERARASQQKTVVEVSDSSEATSPTEFIGFDSEKLNGFETRVVQVLKNEGKHYLVFEKTPFYAEMGGQLGDQGTAALQSGVVMIVDTLKDKRGQFLHQIGSSIDADCVGQTVTLYVDMHRRNSIQRNHSATHLLHWALRKVLGDHVGQAGSLVAPDHLRFDFTHFEALTPGQLDEVERLVNERILANTAVNWKEIPIEEKPDDVIAFFGEKYGSQVRVVDIGGFSKELCGGTHVRATGEIGFFKIVSETAIAAGTRRIEAVSGEGAHALAQTHFNELHQLARTLSCKPDELGMRLESLLEQRSTLTKELQALKQKGSAARADTLASKAQKIGELNWIIEKVSAEDLNALRTLATQAIRKIGDGGVVLGCIFEDKASVLALCSDKAIASGYKAGEIVHRVCAAIDGKGGGKPDFAMGGGKAIDKLEQALKGALL
jgi:alanyl-tRNA synthetase